MTDRDLDFEAAMRALGVRPMGPASKSKPRGARKQPAGAGRAVEPGRGPETRHGSKSPPHGGATMGARAKVLPSMSARRDAPPPAAQQRLPPASVSTAPSAEEAPLRSEIAGLQAELGRLRSALQATQEELSNAELRVQAESVAAAKANRRADVLDGLLKAGAPADRVSLLEHFQAMGVVGTSEMRRLVEALSETGRLDDLLAALTPLEPARFQDWLENGTALLGDCGACPSHGSRAVLRVPVARCEVCKGSDIRRESRKLMDACLTMGLTRLTVVGGSPKYHRQLRELVQHHRLKLRLVPGGTRRSAKQARDDIKGSDMVVIWGPTQLDHSISDLYATHAGLGTVWVSRHRGIATMIRSLTERILAPVPPLES